MKYPKMEWGTMEAIINKLGGMDGAQRFLRGEVLVSEPARRWREENGVIYFTLPPTDGTTGEEWIARLESKDFHIGNHAKSVLRSDDFKPTSGVTTEVAVLKGTLFTDNDRITRNIRAKAYAGTFTQGRKLSNPNAEVACLVREMFSNKELEAMGLWWIVAMHEPIKDSGGGPRLLRASRNGNGCWLNAYDGDPDFRWGRNSGFAFAVSQV